MPSVVPGPVNGDAGTLEYLAYVVPEGALERAPFIWRIVHHKDVGAVRLRPAVFKVVDKRPADIIGKGERQWFLCFPLYDGYELVFPVDVIHGEVEHIPNPQPSLAPIRTMA